MTTILLAGATGLVGSHALRGFLADPRVARIHVLTRRPLPLTHDKLHPHLIELGDLQRWEPPEPINVGCSCLGTTLRKAGSQEAFRLVDQYAVLDLADIARRAGAKRFVLVSSIGASSGARTFYSRVKGEVEDALASQTGEDGYASMVLLQPSLLTGDRTDFRPLERFADWLVRPVAPLMGGRLAKYRPVAAATVARAVVTAALAPAGELTGVVRLTGPFEQG